MEARRGFLVVEALVSWRVDAKDSLPLFQSAVLELACAGGLGGGTVEVSDDGGSPLAASDSDGTLTGPDGVQLLRAPLRFDGRRDRGTNAMLDVSGPDGAALGEVCVKKFSVTPRSSKATLSLRAAGTEVARLEPGDDRGEELVITVDDAPVGTLRKKAKKGFIRTITAYRLDLTGDVDEQTRQLIVAAAIRYHALINEAAAAGRTT